MYLKRNKQKTLSIKEYFHLSQHICFIQGGEGSFAPFLAYIGSPSWIVTGDSLQIYERVKCFRNILVIENISINQLYLPDMRMI